MVMESERKARSVLIELWPSSQDICPQSDDDYYIAGSRGFYDSHKELEENLRKDGIWLQWHTHFPDPRGMGYMPPTIVDFLIWLGAPGLAAILYKTLDLWVKKVNGRRIMVSFGGIKIETTQLTQDQFDKLLQKILNYESRSLDYARRTEEKKRVFQGYPIVDERTDLLESGHLVDLYMRTREELQRKRKTRAKKT